MNILRISHHLSLAALFAFGSLVQAHEYWLDPANTTVNVGSDVSVDIRNGQDFSGSALPYRPFSLEKITVANNTKASVYKGRIGDYPAITTELTTSGIHSITLTTTAKDITYSSWEKFEKFLRYHGLLGELKKYDTTKLPRKDIKESYRRYARTFVNAQAEAGSTNTENAPVDTSKHAAFTPRGDEFELILLSNPLTAADTVQVKLLKGNKPLPARQVEMFWDGQSQLRLTEVTDPNGMASFNLPGNGKYMLNSVYLRKSESVKTDWETIWASVTFEVAR